MKAVAAFFALVIALVFCGCASMRPVAQSDLTFDTVFVAQGMKKDSLYDRVKVWMVANLRSQPEVVEYDNNRANLNMGSLGSVELHDKKVVNSTAKPAIGYEDKEQGSIVGNGIMAYPCPGGCIARADWRVLYTMKADMKDEKYRITFSNLLIAWPASDNGGYPIAVNLGSPVQSMGDLMNIKKGLLDLGGTLNSSLTQKANSNW